MSRFIKRCLRELTIEYKSKPYEYWEKASLPLTFERIFEGKNVQVEIHTLESSDEYLQIGISVDAGWRSFFYPFGQSFIIKKPKI